MPNAPVKDFETLKGFISYSHRDQYYFNVFHEELKFYSEGRNIGNFKIDSWQDGELATGEDYNEAIKTAIVDCDIAILLLSDYFLGSKYIGETELPEILKQKEADGIIIYPIIFAPCSRKQFDFLQQLHFPSLDPAIFNMKDRPNFSYMDVIDSCPIGNDNKIIPNANYRRLHQRIWQDIENSVIKLKSNVKSKSNEKANVSASYNKEISSSPGTGNSENQSNETQTIDLASFKALKDQLDRFMANKNNP